MTEQTPASMPGLHEARPDNSLGDCAVTCDAKIRPFPNPTEVTCEKADPPHDEHSAVLRDYAYPGSESVINWQESDRRTYRGLYIPCDDPSFYCVLPRNHRGRHQR